MRYSVVRSSRSQKLIKKKLSKTLSSGLLKINTQTSQVFQQKTFLEKGREREKERKSFLEILQALQTTTKFTSAKCLPPQGAVIAESEKRKIHFKRSGKCSFNNFELERSQVQKLRHRGEEESVCGTKDADWRSFFQLTGTLNPIFSGRSSCSLSWLIKNIDNVYIREQASQTSHFLWLAISRARFHFASTLPGIPKPAISRY